jgi:hypothetical protein
MLSPGSGDLAIPPANFKAAKWRSVLRLACFMAKLGVRFLGGKDPQNSWRNNIRVRVRAFTVMDIESNFSG